MSELNIHNHATKEFPFYDQLYEKGWIRGCVFDADLGCKECICKSFCLVKGGEDE